MNQRNKNARLLTRGIVGVPPGYGDEHWNDVTLLLDGSDPTDDLSNTNQDAYITNTGSVASASMTGPTGYGTVDALSFNGTSQRLTTSNYTASLFNQDFTIEGWFNLDASQSASYPTLISFRTSGGASILHGVLVYINRAGGTNRLNLALGNGNTGTWLYQQESAVTFTAGWQHIAVTRAGNIYRLFKDGQAILETTQSSTITVTGDFTIMAGSSDGGSPAAGDVFDFKITEGVARYTAAFTPPTASLPTHAPGGRRGVGTEATLRTRGYIGAAPAGGGMLTLYDHYSDALVKPDGLTAGTAGDSAAQILADYPNSTDGIYYIKDGTGTKQVYCDMTNGGWMLYSSFASTNTLDATNYPAWNGNQILHTQLGTYGYAAIGAGIANYSDGVTNFLSTGYAHATGYYGCFWYSTSGPQSGGVGATTWNGPSDVSELRIGWGQGSPSFTGPVYLDINGSQVTSMSSATPLVSTYSFNPAGASHYFGVREDGIAGISFVYMR